VLRNDLADWKCLISEDPHRQLAAGNELFQHDLVIVPERFLDGGCQIARLPHQR
jgi:hypothetical protein